MLFIDDLSISKRGINILTSLGISVFPGTCLIVNGGNGTGKTSLLNCISGIETYGNGKINFDGTLVHIGHKNALNEDLTVLENLEYWASLYGRCETLLAASFIFKLHGYFDIKLKYLSQGWQRKVALTRLVLSSADIWVLDEPYSNLDQESCVILDNLIFSKCSQNGIVVVASHKKENIMNSITINIEDYNINEF